MKYLEVNQNFWNKSTQGYIDSHPEFNNQDMFPSWGIWYRKEEELHLLSNLKPNSKILDIGCGIGNNLIGWAKRGMDCYGVDLSQRMIDAAQQHERCHYICSAVEHMPYADNFFDAAYCNHGAFDFSIPEPALREINRVLRMKATLVVCVYSELAQLCYSRVDGTMHPQLLNDYRPRRLEKSIDSPLVVSLSHSEWIDAFGKSGFQVKKLIELKAHKGDREFFHDSPNRSWSLRWPAEDIWKVEKVMNV